MPVTGRREPGEIRRDRPLGPSPRSSVPPALAALLSGVFPGLGQLAAGRPRRGLAVALPAIALLGAVAAGLVLDRHDLVAFLTSTLALQGLLVLDGVVFVYHAWALVDAYLVAGGSLVVPRGPQKAGALAGLAMIVVLLAASAGVHVYVAASDASIQTSLANMFNPAGPSWLGAAAGATVPPDVALSTIPPDAATARPTGTASSESTAPASPTAPPAPVVYAIGDLPANTARSSDWSADGFLNVLLIGADQGTGGNRMFGLRPDTMILLSVRLATGQAAMYGIPRNLINVPLPAASATHYACHCFGPAPGSGDPLANYLIDYLWQEAALVHPGYYAQYGTGNTWGAAYVRGTEALEGAASALTGLTVDGAVVVNLPGFVALVDALAPGGVTIDVPYEVKQDAKGTKDSTGAPVPGYEPPNGGADIWGIDFKPGVQTMNGTTLLEYARLRHVVTYDGDYYRMARQQLVLKAVRAQLDPCALLPRIPAVMSGLSGALWTDLPVDALPQFAGLAQHVGTANIATYTLDPTATGAVDDVLGPASVAKIHSIVAHGLDAVAPGTGGGAGGAGGLSC